MDNGYFFRTKGIKVNNEQLLATVEKEVLGNQAQATIGIISEIVADISVFPVSKHLCPLADLTPQNNEHAGKKKTIRIRKARDNIDPLPLQCALCTIRTKQFSEIYAWSLIDLCKLCFLEIL